MLILFSSDQDEDTWPLFLQDFKTGNPQKIYQSKQRSLVDVPPVRRDLIKRHLYLVPNSIVVSRGCPHHCDFCYKDAFYGSGKSFYTQKVDDALREIERLPGKHLYFLDNHLFGNYDNNFFNIFGSDQFILSSDFRTLTINTATGNGADNLRVLTKSTVPEPLTILGAGTAVAFGTTFKRKVNKANKK